MLNVPAGDLKNNGHRQVVAVVKIGSRQQASLQPVDKGEDCGVSHGCPSKEKRPSGAQMSGGRLLFTEIRSKRKPPAMPGVVPEKLL